MRGGGRERGEWTETGVGGEEIESGERRDGREEEERGRERREDTEGGVG